MAKSAGISYGELSPGPILLYSGLTRAQAQTELLLALASGEQLAYGEASPQVDSENVASQSLSIAAAKRDAAIR